MNAKSEKVREALSDQLSELDQSLGATIGDATMLSDLKDQIGQLLAGGAAEQDIRSLLHDRFERGGLRQETFQLVKAVLDRYTTEQVATSPFDDDTAPADFGSDTHAELHGDDEFASTTVITKGLDDAAMPDDRVQPGSVLCDRYRLKQRVSGGSMGVVYQAVDQRATATDGETLVAIKVLSAQLSQSDAALRALQQEAAKGRCLLHPNIVRFIDLERDDDLHFIVMEWMPGRTLADILDSPKTRQFDVDDALDIIRQIGRALDYAHRCGIVHADVKPGNIMVLPDGKAKLFDFGVARVQRTKLRDGFDPGELGAITPAYSSMQVLSGEEPAAPDDVYSLGCLMYRLIAGYRVFGPRNASEAAGEGMRPQRLDALSDNQWHALETALSFSRRDRYDTMEAFIEALGDDAPLKATIEGRLSGGVEAGRGSSWFLIPVALLLAAGGGAYLAGWFGDASRPGFERGASSDPATERASEPASEANGPAPDVGPPTEHDDAIETAGPVATREPVPAAPEPVPAEPAEPVIDFSQLPPADYRIELAEGLAPAPTLLVTLRENAGAVTVDLFRGAGAGDGINLKIEEVRHSGNRSPWGSRQFMISDDGALRIPPGQDRARVTLAMSADPLREADQQSTLRVRVSEIADSELAVLEVVLEDDDQRAFEAGLPPNTIAFALSQVSVSERDPAVQVDIMRFNPDNRALTVEYRLSDITATQDQDYFDSGDSAVTFAPGQRSARVLLPLGQDMREEGDEAFAVELVGETAASADVYRRLVVIIRDDEIARP